MSKAAQLRSGRAGIQHSCAGLQALALSQDTACCLCPAPAAGYSVSPRLCTMPGTEWLPSTCYRTLSLSVAAIMDMENADRQSLFSILPGNKFTVDSGVIGGGSTHLK